MGIEAATFVQSLVSTNPVGSDVKSAGDDHLRLLKTVLKATFPNATRAYYFPTSQEEAATFTVLAAEANCVFVVDATGAARTINLPAGLGVGDTGWSIAVMKSDVSANAVIVDPAAAATINGETTLSMLIQYDWMIIVWTGTNWFALVRRWPIVAADVVANLVTNAKLAQMVEATVKGRAAASGTGDPVDLTATELKTILGIQGITAAGIALLDDVSAAAQRTTLGLGALALLAFTDLVYTGTTSGNVTYPVGSVIGFAISGAVPARNAVVPIRLSSTPGQYIDNGAQSLLTGSWRFRGLLSFSSDVSGLAQRVS